MAYVSCDPGRPWWDPIRGIWQDVPASAPREAHEPASIWAWNTRQAGSQPQRLALKNYPGKGGFHPLGLTVSNTDAANLNTSDASSLLLLVANAPYAGRPSLVDAFVHELDSNSELQHHVRLGPDHLSNPKLSPYRISASHEQLSPVLPSQHKGDTSGRKVALPSFYFSSAPSPTEFSSQLGDSGPSAYRNYLSFAKTLLFLGGAPAPPSKLFLYVARAAQTTTILSSISSWPGFPPLAKAWNGGGARAGYNATDAMILTAETSSERSMIQQWDQHWVRGVEAATEPLDDPYADYVRSVGEQKAQVKRGRGGKIEVYMPQFVTFFSRVLRYPATAMGHDDWGRVWTAAGQPTDQVDAWIRYLRETLSAGLLPHQGAQSEKVKRPAALVEQTTHVYRSGEATAHPWEMERMKEVRERGIFIPKEYIGSNVFRSAEEPASKEWKAVSLQQEGDIEREMGFLPTIPTGIAVDREAQVLIVTSAYDERGIAKCSIPSDWAEL